MEDIGKMLVGLGITIVHLVALLVLGTKSRGSDGCPVLSSLYVNSIAIYSCRSRGCGNVQDWNGCTKVHERADFLEHAPQYIGNGIQRWCASIVCQIITIYQYYPALFLVGKTRKPHNV